MIAQYTAQKEEANAFCGNNTGVYEPPQDNGQYQCKKRTCPGFKHIEIKGRENHKNEQCPDVPELAYDWLYVNLATIQKIEY